MDNELSVVEKLGFSTIRIECETALGRSTGTGFFFRFADDGSRFVPGIVTNKHVVAGGTSGRLHFTLRTPDGKPDVGSTFQWNIGGGFMNAWVQHPDPDVDLCVLPIATLIEQAAASGKHFFFTFLDTKLIPSDADIEQFIGMERVVMIGYPNGIWDSRHNFPVFRAGVAATHYRYDWNGRPAFLIDCACFPGSSGSPVLICDIGQVQTRTGFNLGSNRIQLLGILYAGPQHRVDGRLEIVPVPTADRVVPVSTIPNNLGIVLKSRKLQELDQILKRVSDDASGSVASAAPRTD